MSQERGPYNNVRRVQNRANSIDMHERLKEEIFKQTDESTYKYAPSVITTQPGPIVGAAPPVRTVSGTSGGVGIEDVYVYFDSTNMEPTSDVANGEAKFALVSNNNAQPIDGCVSVQLSEFYFPLVENVSTSPAYYFFRRVFMHITSFPDTQAVALPNAQRFHFEFNVDNTNSISVLLQPLQDTFFLRQPLIGINEFNLRFLAPSGKPDGALKKIPIRKTKITVRGVPGSAPARFTIINGDDITQLVDAATIPGTYPGVPYTPAVPIVVYITGFVSSSAGVDDAAVNSQDGVFVTRFLTDMFTLEIGSLNFGLMAASPTATMIIGKNRFGITCRFTTVKPGITNHLVPVHE